MVAAKAPWWARASRPGEVARGHGEGDAAYDDFRSDQFGFTCGDPGDSGDDLDNHDYLASTCDTDDVA